MSSLIHKYLIETVWIRHGRLLMFEQREPTFTGHLPQAEDFISGLPRGISDDDTTNSPRFSHLVLSASSVGAYVKLGITSKCVDDRLHTIVLIVDHEENTLIYLVAKLDLETKSKPTISIVALREYSFDEKGCRSIGNKHLEYDNDPPYLQIALTYSSTVKEVRDFCHIHSVKAGLGRYVELDPEEILLKRRTPFTLVKSNTSTDESDDESDDSEGDLTRTHTGSLTSDTTGPSYYPTLADTDTYDYPPQNEAQEEDPDSTSPFIRNEYKKLILNTYVEYKTAGHSAPTSRIYPNSPEQVRELYLRVNKILWEIPVGEINEAAMVYAKDDSPYVDTNLKVLCELARALADCIRKAKSL